MKRMILVVCMLVMAGVAQAGEKVVLATLDWEPYVGQNMKNQGYVVEVVTEAFKRGGFDVEIQFHQWSRVVGLAKTGKVDGYFPEYLSEAIKKYATFSAPMPGGPLGFFKAKNNDIPFNTLEDLKGKKIGVVKGYVNTKEFDSASFLTKDPAKDDLTNLKKLIAGRLDLVVSDKYVGTYLLQKNLADKADSIEFMAKSLANPELFLCISNKVDGSDAKLEAYNKGLTEMISDGTFDTIVKSHGL